jgi:hypothetical protein
MDDRGNSLMKNLLLRFFPFTNRAVLWFLLVGTTIAIFFFGYTSLVARGSRGSAFAGLGLLIFCAYFALAAFSLFTRTGQEMVRAKRRAQAEPQKRNWFWWGKLAFGLMLSGYIVLILFAVFVAPYFHIRPEHVMDEYALLKAAIVGLIWLPLLLKYLK